MADANEGDDVDAMETAVQEDVSSSAAVGRADAIFNSSSRCVMCFAQLCPLSNTEFHEHVHVLPLVCGPP